MFNALIVMFQTAEYNVKNRRLKKNKARNIYIQIQIYQFHAVSETKDKLQN